ncbi:RICIN domain-containing protein [Streptomyces vastus]|uniref:Ricin B lectin domain-containing protein n=1 Tax=Streptomyces vastus TaxID=285451 RepID=A0ABP6CW80_9ACTN
MRRNRLVLAAAGSALALSGALGTQAVAADAGGGTILAPQTFKNQVTARCMDDSDRGFRTVGCHGRATQQWNVHVWNDGTRQLKNVATGRCIDDSSAGLRTWTCWPGSDSRSKNQSWYVHRWNDGSIQFKSQATSRCIDDSSAGLRTWTCWPGSDSRSKNQSWF